MSKPGRNEPCYCGSGKKYKKCCLEKDNEKALEPVVAESEMDEEEERGWEPEKYPVYDDNLYDAEEDDDIDDDFEDDEEYPETTKENSITNKPYPEITAAEEKLVEDWWDAYKKMEDTDKEKAHLLAFIDMYPHLVENLGLEHEVLFDLGSGLRQQGRVEEFILLLLRVRNEFPNVYIRSAGFYDLDIITWLISHGRTEEIPQYLHYFKEYPDEYVDELFSMVDLLQATNNTSLIPELIMAIAGKITSSSKVIGGYKILAPMTIHAMSKYLYPGYSDTDIPLLLDDLKRMLPDNANNIEPDSRFWKARFENTLKPFERWQDTIPQKEAQVKEKCYEISHNFMRYLHETTGISWISAQFHSLLIWQYLFECSKQPARKSNQFFDFSGKRIDKVVLEVSYDVFFIKVTKALALLNGIYYFAGYLQVCGNIDEKEKLIIQAACSKIYHEHFPHLKQEYAEAACFQEFPKWK